MTTLVIGVGNRDRGDDGAGLEVARRLRESRPEGVEVIEQPGDAADLIEAWQGAECVVLVDAALCGGPAGRVHRFNARREALPAVLRHASGHALGVAEALELSRALGTLPARVVVYGIEGRCFEPGARLSPEVEEAAGRVAEHVRRELSWMPSACERSEGDDDAGKRRSGARTFSAPGQPVAARLRGRSALGS
jgi:hydrogenase maturation protease